MFLQMEREITVKQYHLHNWSESTVPDSSDQVLELVNLVQQERTKSTSNSPVLVHCRYADIAKAVAGAFACYTIVLLPLLVQIF